MLFKSHRNEVCRQIDILDFMSHFWLRGRCFLEKMRIFPNIWENSDLDISALLKDNLTFLGVLESWIHALQKSSKRSLSPDRYFRFYESLFATRDNFFSKNRQKSLFFDMNLKPRTIFDHTVGKPFKFSTKVYKDRFSIGLTVFPEFG